MYVKKVDQRAGQVSLPHVINRVKTHLP